MYGYQEVQEGNEACPMEEGVDGACAPGLYLIPESSCQLGHAGLCTHYQMGWGGELGGREQSSDVFPAWLILCPAPFPVDSLTG